MRPIAFSTGAVAKGDIASAVSQIRQAGLTAIELSALRFDELQPLVASAESLDLSQFSYISVHAPSRYEPQDEPAVIFLLEAFTAQGWPVVAHPDAIIKPAPWRRLGDLLLIENMDNRKPIGQTAKDIEQLLSSFPDAKLCFDIGHARQIDPAMREAEAILAVAGDRLAQIHLSEVNAASGHEPISEQAASDFRKLARLIPPNIPIILETPIDSGQSAIEREIAKARDIFG